MPADPSKRPTTLRLAVGWFAAPLAWALHLALVYALAGWDCRHPLPLALYAASLLCLSVALGGTWVAWRNVQVARSPGSVRYFLGCSGCLLGLLFAATITMQSLPFLLVEGCGR
ncbi:hypothetical protein [Ectopseudomonas guguanensis]|uniref:hypothetical protein n=1 Tax=Ectopseudomonas guguanensis TaxID=1198456 RepID=UPI002353A7FC|nr:MULTISPECIES: hypothetical protein [Pseudomonas]